MIRRNVSKTEYLAQLQKQVKGMSGGKPKFEKTVDSRIWKLSVDEKTKTGSAILRPLNAPADEDYPYIKLFSHGFKDPKTNKWFIADCPSTCGGLPSDVCPVCRSNYELHNASKDPNDPRKAISASRKRKLQYPINVLIINDPAVPENNGKVFIYKCNVPVFKKITEKLCPEFDDMVPCNVFDFEEGANLRLRQHFETNPNGGGFPKFDNTSFDNPAPIGNADFIAKIESQLHSVVAFKDPKNFKSYEDLEKYFLKVTGEKTNTTPKPVPTNATTNNTTSVSSVEPEQIEPEQNNDPGDSESFDEDFLSKLAQDAANEV